MRELEGSEAVKLIHIIQKSPKEALEYIKVNDIDPSYGSEIISSYFLIHIKDENVLYETLNELNRIGAKTASSPSVLKDVIRYNRAKVLEKYIKEGCLEYHQNKKEITYFFNVAIMRGAKECFELLALNSDISKTLLENGLPYPLHAAIYYESKWAIDYFVDNDLFMDYFRGSDFINEIVSLVNRKEINSKELAESIVFIKDIFNKFTQKKYGIDCSKEINAINFESKTLGDDIYSIIKLWDYRSLTKKVNNVGYKEKNISKI